MAPTKSLRSGLPAWDGQRFAFADPRVPPAIRQAVGQLARPDDSLYFADTETGGEWWLLDQTGELIESFWLVD